jgi:hypothetical protein
VLITHPHHKSSRLRVPRMKTSILLTLFSALSLVLAATVKPQSHANTQRRTKHLRPEVQKRQADLEPIVGMKGADILGIEGQNIPHTKSNNHRWREQSTCISESRCVATSSNRCRECCESQMELHVVKYAS